MPDTNPVHPNPTHPPKKEGEDEPIQPPVRQPEPPSEDEDIPEDESPKS